MNLLEIKMMLHTLIQYKETYITHTIPGVVELYFCKVTMTFKITVFNEQKTYSYLDYDVEKVSHIINKILRLHSKG
ncbi:hypothetical protein O0Q50_23635 [Priestia aryabhattai]|uniref:DUF3081 domain-containing protein n=1 Tax=Priestia aryabhattai TaxID=412384 RepID=A0AAX6NE43_PRIAR|nr:hypothetical protein [Priestia aryabhattai]MDU9694181.1 hypothetical protein [Priestia aryabhattai]